MIKPLVLALALTAAPAVAAASSADAAAPACITHWGSLDKPAQPFTSGPPSSSGTPSASPTPSTAAQVAAITNVRTGRHACFDRLVVDIGAHGGAGYSVRYLDAVLNQGQGAPIALRGGARLEIVLMAPDYDINTGAPTYHFGNARELRSVTGFSTFRQVAYGGSFEGYTTIGLGVRARLPMRVLVLDGPGGGSRVVIDVAHHW